MRTIACYLLLTAAAYGQAPMLAPEGYVPRYEYATEGPVTRDEFEALKREVQAVADQIEQFRVELLEIGELRRKVRELHKRQLEIRGRIREERSR